MPISTWIRDLFGIRKDIVDTKKAKLEIEKLEAEERERSLITPASLDDVKKYDPKTRSLIEKVINVLLVVAFLGTVLLTAVPRMPRQLWETILRVLHILFG